MMWLKRVLASFLSIIFFIALVATVMAYSANAVFANPQRTESWLDQNSLYQNFINNAVSQAGQSLGLQQSQLGVTLDSTVVQQAAESAFSKQLFTQSLGTVIDSNYQWLEGKNSEPNYVINLSTAKQKFTSEISIYAQQLVASLPACTPQQLAAIYSTGGFDPLNATCRPASLSTQMIADSVSQKISSSGFLRDSVVTSNNIGSVDFTGSSNGKPYYEKFAQAPDVFQYIVEVPWLYAVIAIVSSLLMLPLIGLRRSVRRIGIILIVADVILIIIKLLTNSAVDTVDKHLINPADSSQLKASLTKFVDQVGHRATRVELCFVVAYLILALILLLISRYGKRPKRRLPAFQSNQTENNESIVSRLSHKPRQASNMPPQPLRPPEPELPELQKPKKQRLIQ